MNLHMKKLKSVLAAFLLLWTVSPGAAEQHSGALYRSTESSCAELVRECFAYSNVDRSRCFYAAAAHSFCRGTATGGLSFKRWRMTPGRVLGDETSYSLLGPQMVDSECLANFDNLWSAELLQDKFSLEKLLRLEGRLEACRRPPANEILRP